MAETIDVVAHRDIDPEPLAEVALPDLRLFPKRRRRRQIAVRLNPPPSHRGHPPVYDVAPDAREASRIEPLDRVVEPRLAARDDDLRILIEDVAIRPGRVQDLVHALPQRPAPHGIQMRVQDDVHGKFHDDFPFLDDSSESPLA
ncbi:MAG: hypothetical protein NTW86_01385 [Candidatus Sumerlaeota bacterium]|nr:hypothetical protein [Candidatus Sumerlaeota bacterium]